MQSKPALSAGYPGADVDNQAPLQRIDNSHAAGSQARLSKPGGARMALGSVGVTVEWPVTIGGPPPPGRPVAARAGTVHG